ncbi:MAG: hypothetical protein ACRDDH_07880 [Cetobacterium sp.]|uniref:hypothetical protein n=1 Tax=Cetobacterium sp. TaxID=2071632 RepID=UPI003EE4DA56
MSGIIKFKKGDIVKSKKTGLTLRVEKDHYRGSSLSVHGTIVDIGSYNMYEVGYFSKEWNEMAFYLVEKEGFWNVV